MQQYAVNDRVSKLVASMIVINRKKMKKKVYDLGDTAKSQKKSCLRVSTRIPLSIYVDTGF